MLGGGQLGRMFAEAAHRRGYRVAVLSPEAESPAQQVADLSVIGAYESAGALQELMTCCAAVSYEFENIPVESVRMLERTLPVHPSSGALAVAQHRGEEKRLAARCAPDTPPVPWRMIESARDLRPAWDALGGPCILKTARMGYDGKGQCIIDAPEQLASAYKRTRRELCVLERKIELHSEISVVVARSFGQSVRYPVIENLHRDGILHRSRSPASVPEAVARAAQDSAAALAAALDYRGVLAVEYFLDADGRIYFNEMAPRPHNSGHHTIDSCDVSQFDQQVLTLAGHPPAPPAQRTPAVMVNLLGDLWRGGEPDWSIFEGDERLHLHLYGKRRARPGRKMGHFCVLDEDAETACARAEELHRRLAP